MNYGENSPTFPEKFSPEIRGVKFCKFPGESGTGNLRTSPSCCSSFKAPECAFPQLSIAAASVKFLVK